MASASCEWARRRMGWAIGVRLAEWRRLPMRFEWTKGRPVASAPSTISSIAAQHERVQVCATDIKQSPLASVRVAAVRMTTTVHGSVRPAQAALRTALSSDRLSRAGRSEGDHGHHRHRHRRQMQTQRQLMPPRCSAAPLPDDGHRSTSGLSLSSPSTAAQLTRPQLAPITVAASSQVG
jgi:hypothetical protein